MSRWPFAEPRDHPVVTRWGILRRETPILQVRHEAGEWQFLDGTGTDEAGTALAGLATLLALEPGLGWLADLPEGWEATRDSADQAFRRAPLTARRHAG